MKALRVSLAVVLLLTGCELLAPDSEERQQFNDALAAWKRQGVDNYSFQYQRSCECIEEWTRPAFLVVRAGRVIEATDVQNGEARNTSYYMTVDALFARIRKAFDDDAHRIEIDYHPELHYPTAVLIDPDRNVADEELTLHLSALMKLQ